MKERSSSVNDHKRLITATVITMLLISVSLATTGIISALCDLSAFTLLWGVLWLRSRESPIGNRSYESVIPSSKIKIEP